MKLLILIPLVFFISCKDDDGCFDCFIASLNESEELETRSEKFCGDEEEAEEFEIQSLILDDEQVINSAICREVECIRCFLLIENTSEEPTIIFRQICGSKSEAREFEEETGAICQL